VRATLAVSLKLHGTLWGMLICHHNAPRTLPPGLRVSCELLGRVTSLMISKRRDDEATAEAALRADSVRAISNTLPDRWGGDGEMAKALGAVPEDLLSVCSATGAILRLGGITVSLGQAPEGEDAEKFLSALLQAAPAGADTFACESLQTLLPPQMMALAGGMAAGALVLKLTNRPAEAIAWLRLEHAHLVRWGGDPRRPVENAPLDGDQLDGSQLKGSQLRGSPGGQKLSPRRSFDIWKQEVRGRSIPFCDTDLAAATALRDEIDRRLAAGAEAMRAARDEAQQAMRAKSDFLATMSHEIRSPLSGLLGVLELLRATRLDADQGRMAAMIHNSATMLLAVLNDILDFSKIEAGAMSTVIEPVRLRQVVDEVVQPHAVTAAKKTVAMTVSIDPALPDHIATDRLRLSQIFNNLLSNAVKFTSSGEVSVRLGFSREAGEGTAGKPWLLLSVRDTGIGMSAPVMAQLFAPFMQADGSTTRMFGGTGLGLAISRKLARLLDGDLSVTSQPGVGSEFTLRLPILPCAEQAGLQPAEAVSSPVSLPQDRRVLVADDDATIRWLSQRQLERLGFSVDVAEDGEAALAKLQAEPYDLLLTDCHMPRMNGVALTQAVRGSALEVLRALPIIGLTADVTEAQRSICLGAGMTELATKPLTIERLSRLLLAHLPSTSRKDAPAAPLSLRAVPFEDQIFLSMFPADDEEGKAWLRAYLANAGRDLAELDGLLAAADGAELPRAVIVEVAHRMAGSAFSVGAMLLGAEAKALQAAAEDEVLDDLTARRRALARELSAAKAAIDVFLKEGLPF
jgi:light-regulated signal transduction histidine kinase (bacteriophytochrome)/CheY-like chemotaxis protein